MLVRRCYVLLTRIAAGLEALPEFLKVLLRCEVKLQQILSALEAEPKAPKVALNVREAAAYLGVSTSQLYKWSSSRKIKHYHPPHGKHIWFTVEDLREFVLQSPVYTEKELLSKTRLALNKTRNTRNAQ